MIQRIKPFFAEVTAELKKVTWPGRVEVRSTTVVVIISVFFFGFYLFAADLVCAWAIAYLKGLF